MSDVFSAADNGDVTLLGLLDLSAAFDTVDHLILIERLTHKFGINGSVLGWFRSYITGRTQCVRYQGHTSAIVPVTCGVPQGSVLGPVLFIIYTSDTINICHKNGFLAHAYADDLQLYNHTDPSLCSSVLARFSSCVSELNDWMASNRLQLNPSKTEIIWLGTARLLRDCPMGQQCIAGAIVKPSTQVRDLGVMVDNELSLTAHINQLTRSCYYYIRQLRSIRRSLTTDSALVLALIHSRLDYCNGVLAGLPVHQINQLQSVQRAAARLVLRLPARSSLSNLMTSELHWLPYPQRITFKLCIFAYKCNHGMAPSYLSDLCVRLANVPGRSNLRSASNGDLLIPRINKGRMGARGFSYACPTAWNSLNDYLKNDTLTFCAFKKQLKTYLFTT